MLAKARMEESRKEIAESYELECIDLDEDETKEKPEFKLK